MKEYLQRNCAPPEWTAVCHSVYEQGVPGPEIAQRFGVSEASVHVWARLLGWSLELRREGAKRWRITRQAMVARKLYESGLNTSRIAYRLNMSKSTVAYWRHNHEWARDVHWEARQRRCHYWRKVKRKEKWRCRRDGLTLFERDTVRYGRAGAEGRAAKRDEREAARKRRMAANAILLEVRSIRRIARRARVGRTRAYVVRLRREDPTARGLCKDSLEYRARYRYDEHFRAKEIARRHKRRAWEEGVEDDGTLTPAVVCALFAAAEQCPYCGVYMCSNDKVLDHMFPRSRGGWHGIENAVVCCGPCNSAKRARTPLEFFMSGKMQESRTRSVLRNAILPLWVGRGVS